jgi:hypothetical protein
VVGDLEMRLTERLRHGDIRAIHPGSAFIHSLFHLDRPSLTLVARTGVSDPRASPQYTYLKPHFGIPSEGGRRERTTRRQELLKVAYAHDRERCLALVDEVIGREDFESVLKYAIALNQLDKAAALALLERARPRHGELVDLAARTLEETERDALIRSRRGRVYHPEHRFFMAALLNAPHRDALLKMVSDCYPGPPVERVMGWLRALTASTEDRTANLLGAALGEASLNMVEWRLRQGGCFEDFLRAELPDRTVDEDRVSLRTLWEAIEEIAILHTLFVPGPAGAGTRS